MSWTSYLKSVGNFHGDLNKMSAPAWILAPVSLIEYSQYWSMDSELLNAPASMVASGGNVPIELRRFLAVIRWFVATLNSQYGNTRGSSEKKPLNPFLGELFVGKREGTVVITEQVNHHPPVTAFASWNKEQDVLVEGTSKVQAFINKTSFSVKQYGCTYVKYGSLNESYLLSIPQIHIEGLMRGVPKVELEGFSYVQSSSGYYARFEFKGKRRLGGGKNRFICRIYNNWDAAKTESEALFVIAGCWSGKSWIVQGCTVAGPDDPLFLDVSHSKTSELVVKPVEKQHPLESRRAWLKVEDAIKKGDTDTAGKAKVAIENEQRALRKTEEEKGIEWKRRWFDNVDYDDPAKDDTYIELYRQAHLSPYDVPSGTPDTDTTRTSKTHWRFDLDKWLAETEVVA